MRKAILIACILCIFTLIATTCDETCKNPDNGNQSYSHQSKTKAETQTDYANHTESSPKPAEKANTSIFVFSGNGYGSKVEVYVVINTDLHTIQRFTSASPDITEEGYSGNWPNTIYTSNRSYSVSDDGNSCTEKVLSGRHKSKYTICMGRTTQEIAKSVKTKWDTWFDNYDARFRECLVQLGQYEQDGNTEDGAEAIEWIILHQDGDRCLVVSNYVLDSQKFNDIESGYIGCTWSNSTIRTWLNENFYYSAFSDQERQAIIATQITQEGTTSNDKVFLLSYEEVQAYFPQDISTYQAALIPSQSNGTIKYKRMCNWWLRDNTDKEYKKCYIDDEGRYKTGYTDDGYGIRPAMWIDTSKIFAD